MLYQISLSHILVILTEPGLVPVEQLRQTPRLILSDHILTGFLEHSLQVVRNLRRCGGTSSDPCCLSPSLVMFCSSMLVKVLMLSPAASSKGWLVELIQRTMTFPLAPVRLMLLASTTLLLRPSILARHGCITLDSRKVQTPSVVGWQSF